MATSGFLERSGGSAAATRGTMRTNGVFGTLAFGLAAFAAFSGTAVASMTEVFGGPGGRAFSMTCEDGHFLVGLRARAGAWVDGIGLVCAPFDPESGKVASALVPAGWTGGTGGMAQEIACRRGEAVTAVGLAHTRGGGLERQYVNTVDIGCDHAAQMDRCISSGEGCGQIPSRRVGMQSVSIKHPLIPQIGVKTPDLSKRVEYRYDGLYCLDDEYATGIQGRSGVYVDAIGLICARKPDVAITTPPIKRLGKRSPERRHDLRQTAVVGSASTALDDGVVVSDGCRAGFVHRLASARDLVCVPPESHTRTRSENARAGERRDPAGAYGPASCRAGFVWREAHEGDTVCVTPEVRALVAEENRLAPGRSATR